MEIKRKAIIKVNSKFTKGKNWLYLVLFNDFRTEFCQCVRIYLGGDHLRNDILEIPCKYVATRYMPGFINTFTGFSSIRYSDITEVVSELPDNLYNKIIRGIMLTFMGMCKIENPNGRDYKYKVIDRPISITIDGSSLFNAIISNFTIDDESITPESIISPENEETSEVNISESTIQISEEEDKENQLPFKEEKSTKQKSIAKSTKKKTDGSSIVKIGDKVYSEQTIQDIKKEYTKLTDKDDKLDYIYRIWAINEKIPIMQVYNIIIKNEPARPTKKSIMLSKEEFAFMMRESFKVIMSTPFTTYNGYKKIVNSTSSIRNIKTACKSLYFGTEVTAIAKPEIILSKSEKQTIKELIDEGKSKDEILTLFEKDDKRKRKAIISLINDYMKISGSIDTSNRFILIKKYPGYDKDTELQKIVEYFENNFERIGVIASGIIPKDFIDYDHNKSIMVAIYLNKARNIDYRIMGRLGEYVRKEALDLYLYMIGSGKSARFKHSYVNCDKAKNNKRIRQETIYGFLHFNRTKKPYTDKLNVQEQNFINLLNIDKKDYLEDRDFVLANMSKFDSWSKAMFRLDKKA